MKNKIIDGNIVPLIAPATLAPGDLVAVGSLVGVAQGAAPAGGIVQTHLNGVFDGIPLEGSQVIGDRLYYDPTNNHLTPDDNSGANPPAGHYLGSGQIRLAG